LSPSDDKGVAIRAFFKHLTQRVRGCLKVKEGLNKGLAQGGGAWRSFTGHNTG